MNGVVNAEGSPLLAEEPFHSDNPGCGRRGPGALGLCRLPSRPFEPLEQGCKAVFLEKTSDGRRDCCLEERTQDLVDGAHVVLEPYILDRAPIKDLLMLVAFPGKLGDEGGHCKSTA